MDSIKTAVAWAGSTIASPFKWAASTGAHFSQPLCRRVVTVLFQSSGPIKGKKETSSQDVLNAARAKFVREIQNQATTNQGAESNIKTLYNSLYTQIIDWSTATASIKTVSRIIQFLNMKTLPVYNNGSDAPDLSLVLNRLRQEKTTKDISSELYRALTTYNTRIEDIEEWTDRLKRHGSNVVSFILVYILFDWFIKPFTNWTITTLANTLKQYIDENGLPVKYLISKLKLVLETVNMTTASVTDERVSIKNAVKGALCPASDNQAHHAKIIALFYRHSTSIAATFLVKMCEGINKLRSQEDRVNLFTLVKKFVTESLSPSNSTQMGEGQPASAMLQAIRSMMFATFTQVTQLEVTTEKSKNTITAEELKTSQIALIKTLRDLESQEQLKPMEVDIKKTLIALLRSMHDLISLKADQKEISAVHLSSKKFFRTLTVIAAGQMPKNLDGLYTFLAEECAPLFTSTVSQILLDKQNHHSIRILLLQQVARALSEETQTPEKNMVESDIKKLAQLTIADLFVFMCKKLKTPSNEIVIAFDRAIGILSKTLDTPPGQGSIFSSNKQSLALCISMEKDLTKITNTLEKTIDSNRFEHDSSDRINQRLMLYRKTLTIHIAKQELQELLHLDLNDERVITLNRIKDLSKFLLQHEITIKTDFNKTSEYAMGKIEEKGLQDKTHADMVETFESNIETLKLLNRYALEAAAEAAAEAEAEAANMRRVLQKLSDFFEIYHDDEVYENDKKELVDDLTSTKQSPRTKQKAQLPQWMVKMVESREQQFEGFASNKVDDLIEFFQLDFLPEALIHALFTDPAPDLEAL